MQSRLLNIALAAGSLLSNDMPLLRRSTKVGPGERSIQNILLKAQYNNALLAGRKTRAGKPYPTYNPNFRWGSTPHVTQEQRRANKLLNKAAKASGERATMLAQAASVAQFMADLKASNANASRKKAA